MSAVGTRTATRSTQQLPMPPAGRRSRRGPASASTTVSRVNTASDEAPVPQSTAAVGRSAPRRATSTIHATQSEASVPSRSPAQGQASPTSPPARPSTVAGPTAGATARFATTATMLTCPEIAATSGVHASWAVAGTAIASASHRGSHRHIASRQPGANSRIPAVATTDNAKPTLVASPGSTSNRATTAAPSVRAPRSRPSVPIASSPTVPMAAARTTLGSVRASSTNPTMPTAPSAYSQRPRAPHHRPSTSRKPTTRVRLVPETARRWVRPVVRKSSARPGSRPVSSPSTSAGTSAR